MNEVARMNREIRWISLLLMTIVAIICALIWRDQILNVAGGVIIGAFTGLIGFQMINHMSANIEHASNAKFKGYISYMIRYIFYALIFAISIVRGINVFALLAGVVCHKLSIIVYSVRYREEMD